MPTKAPARHPSGDDRRNPRSPINQQLHLHGSEGCVFVEVPGWKVWLYPGGVSVGLPGGTKVGVGLGVGLVLGVGVGLGVDVELPLATNCECRSCCGPDVDDVTVMAVPTEISTASAVTPLAVASCRGVIANMFLC